MYLMPSNINIRKANGDSEKFSPEKVISSLKRSGANKQEIKQVLRDVYPNLREGMKTEDLYHLVFRSLDQVGGRGRYIAGRYSLKKAIWDLGPTGFPFEQFVSGLLQQIGYTTETNLILQGDCVTHEIDVSAVKGDEKDMIEAKFHKKMGYKTDIKTALYVYARFLDLNSKYTNAWIFTNTKITSEVVKYSLCRGIKVTSWDYPNGNSLRELVDRTHLHPITSLIEIDSITRQTLLDHNIIFIKDLPKAEFLFKNQKKYFELCRIAEDFSKTHLHTQSEK